MFETSFLAPPGDLLIGAITGFVFGFLLQKAEVTRYDTILGQFLLERFTVVKVMLTAIVVGAAGVYALLALGAIESLQVKTMSLPGIFIGGGIFGVGMALLGYCPGTAIGAIGQGSRDAVWGCLGMLAGAGLYAESYSWLSETVLSRGDYGEVTMVTASGFSPGAIIAVLVILTYVFFRRLEQWERNRFGHEQPVGLASPNIDTAAFRKRRAGVKR